jgi:L-fuconolactonase
MTMRIDAHQHFWETARGDYGWLTPALPSLFRDFGPADLAPLMTAAAIDRTILVQAAPTVAETGYLLEIAKKTEFVAGVVGWADFDAPDAVAQVKALAENRLLVGLRPMIHNIAYYDWMLYEHLPPVFRAIQRAGLVFDALVRPIHLSRLLVLADRYPDLSIVIDHGAKPDIAGGVMQPWAADMAALAARQNVSCKLSGLVTEAGADWDEARLKPYVDHLIAIFGPGRLIFGTDWPVVTLAASHARWVDAAEALTAHLPGDNRAAIFGGNAQRIYLARRGRR